MLFNNWKIAKIPKKLYYDRNTEPKNEFLPGQSVYVQKLIKNGWTPEIIAKKHRSPRIT
jgi:hypothetical protein